jgi:hypothetical protein
LRLHRVAQQKAGESINRYPSKPMSMYKLSPIGKEHAFFARED